MKLISGQVLDTGGRPVASGCEWLDEPAEDAFHREARFICRINVEEIFLMADNSGRDSDLRNVSSRDVVYNARRHRRNEMKALSPLVFSLTLPESRPSPSSPIRILFRLAGLAETFRLRDSSSPLIIPSCAGIFYSSLSGICYIRVFYFTSRRLISRGSLCRESISERMWDKSDCRPFAFLSERFRDSLFSHLQGPIRDDHPE